MLQTRTTGKATLLFAGLLALGACTPPVNETAEEEPGITEEVMAQLSVMAAPYQNVQTVIQRPDGCYWYRHVGPVETTMLPLRTVDGRRICAQRVAQAAG